MLLQIRKVIPNFTLHILVDTVDGPTTMTFLLPLNGFLSIAISKFVVVITPIVIEIAKCFINSDENLRRAIALTKTLPNATDTLCPRSSFVVGRKKYCRIEGSKVIQYRGMSGSNKNG